MLLFEDDCAYEDVSAPLPEIAQRLYNDHLRRRSDTIESQNVVYRIPKKILENLCQFIKRGLGASTPLEASE